MSTERSISAVLHDIVGNVQNIVRSEIRLAKTEATEELGKARSAGVMLGVGAFLLLLGTIFLLLAAVYALSLVMEPWAAALTVGAVVSVIAAFCCGAGVRRFKSVRAVPKTSATLKENVEWAKHPTR
jgi:uncharacterized membrane protein YqjE